MSSKRFGLVVFLVLAVALAACQSALPQTGDTAGTSEAVDQSGINEATFVATEYVYQGPESIPGGWSRLTLDNQGQQPHDLIMVRLAEGKTVEDVMAALEAEGPPEWATLYGGVSAQAGQSESYVVDLEPGSYVMFSFGDEEQGPPDAAQGMIRTLTVTAAESDVAESDLPQADVTVDMLDYTFARNGDIQAGEQVLRVSNKGKEVHEMIVFRLKEGATLEDLQPWLSEEGTPPEGEPPFEDVGSTFLSPGITAYMTMDFQPGQHVFYCFLPSPANEMKPHFMLGMVHEVMVEG